MRLAPALLLALACALTGARASAQESAPAASGGGAGASAGAGAGEAREPLTPRVRLRYDLLVDGIATGVMAAALVTWTVAKPETSTATCVICDGDVAGRANAVDDLFRDSLRRRDGTAAHTASDVLGYAGGPVLGAALTFGVAAADRRVDEAPVNALLVAEASLAAVLVNEGLTSVLRRERPAVHALEGEEKAAAVEERDGLDSFPGGHTASIMAITASTATVATLRGYRLAPLVWMAGTMLGITSSYLRIAADQGYLTDELAGAFVGLGLGAGIPLLFHGRAGEPSSAASRWLRGATVTSRTVPGGRVVGLGWAF